MACAARQPRVLILDHALIVQGVPVHGPGLSVFDTLLSQKPWPVDYLAHCLNNEGRSYYMQRRAGVTVRRRVGIPLRWLPRPLAYGYGVVYSIVRCVWRRHELCIAINPLNFLAGYLLKRLGRVGQIVVYSADYSERRFASPALNRIYHALDRFAIRHADQVWSVSRAICQLRVAQGVPPARLVHMPNSPQLAQFAPQPLAAIQRHQVVYVFGAITREADIFAKHHFPWVFAALQALGPRVAALHLLLIGRGAFQDYFTTHFPEAAVPQRVTFCDITVRAALLEALCRSAVGLAFYDLSGADHLRYGDSMKLREYFAAGLPVITTPGHSVADEVAEYGLGFVVATQDECTRALATLLTDEATYAAMRQRVLAYATRMDKAVLLDAALAKLAGNAYNAAA